MSGLSGSFVLVAFGLSALATQHGDAPVRTVALREEKKRSDAASRESHEGKFCGIVVHFSSGGVHFRTDPEVGQQQAKEVLANQAR